MLAILGFLWCRKISLLAKTSPCFAGNPIFNIQGQREFTANSCCFFCPFLLTYTCSLICLLFAVFELHIQNKGIVLVIGRHVNKGGRQSAEMEINFCLLFLNIYLKNEKRISGGKEKV